MTLPMVTHEMGIARRVSDRLVFMHAGRVRGIGPPDMIFGAPPRPEPKQFLSSSTTETAAGPRTGERAQRRKPDAPRSCSIRRC